MSDFKCTDFVQVKHIKILESGEPAEFWRNALYVNHTRDCHVVIYTDGTKELINNSKRIKAGKDQ